MCKIMCVQNFVKTGTELKTTKKEAETFIGNGI